MTGNILRFAPSPTGYLHIGNVRTAIFNYLLAKKNEGKFILRLDDTDKERSTQYFIDQIKYDLEWLGIEWDIVKQQSKRLERYQEVLRSLIKDKSVYECFEGPTDLELKRKKQLNSGLPPIYDRYSLSFDEDEKKKLRIKQDGYWRLLLSGEKVSWNDSIAGYVEIQTNSISDPILVKANGQILYTLASVVDDIDYNITDIVRGVDHLTNTAVQIEIFKTFLKNYPRFAHHSLIVNPMGKNFSKRAGSMSIKELRDSGVEAAGIFSMLVNLGNGQKLDIKHDIDDFAKDFDLSKFSSSPIKFNKEDLFSVSRKALSKLRIKDISAYLLKIGVPHERLEAFWDMSKDNIQSRKDLTAIWELCKEGSAAVTQPKNKEYIKTAMSLIPNTPRDEKSWKIWTDKVKVNTGRSGKDLYMPLRVFLTGKENGPDMNKLFPFLNNIKNV